MGKKKSVPGIRLSQFDNEWIEHAAGELLTERVDLSPKSNEYPLMAFVANQGIVPKGERYDRSALVTDTENKLYKKTELGDFIYSSNNLESGSIGLNNYGKATISPVYSIFAPTELGVSSFLGRRLVRSDFIKEMVKWRQGVIYGQWRIHEADFEKITVRVPNVDEQIEIGGFLQQIDNLILSGQKKLEKLQNLKLSMLEKMFPKNGAVVPEVRFKGFEKPWQTICLGDIASEITRTDKSSEAPIMMITAANGFIDQSDRYSFNNAGQSLAKYIVLKRGELAYNHGASKLRPFGSCFALDVDEARIPYVYHCFAIGDHNPYFVSRVLNNKETEKQLRKLVTSGARMDGLLNISYEEYTTVSVQLPERDEQDRIAEYFKNLETLIALCQQELDKLQSLKKGLLEKMFV